MSIDLARVRRAAPLALPLVIVAAGWLLLIGPAMTGSVQEERAVDGLRDQLAQLQAAVAGPPPPPVSSMDPVAAFTRRTAAGDASSRVVLQLATLAQRASAINLSIETGARVAVTGSDGPRASGSRLSPDPRLALFGASLAYTPITMSFDADFTSVGEVLWALRDLPTTIELRSVQITPRATNSDTGTVNDTRVHVAMTIFAYAREARDEA